MLYVFFPDSYPSMSADMLFGEIQVCLYYLVLRGLDTVEDDMTLPDEKKQKVLRSFHEHTLTDGWNFKESGPDEADRQLLVEYENVVTELKLLSPK